MTSATDWLPPGAVAWPMHPDAIRVRMTDKAVARLPGLARAAWPQLERLAPGSPVRRGLITRLLGAGFAALNARDWDLPDQMFSPEVVLRTGSNVPLDIPTLAEGWEALRTGVDRAVQDTPFRFRPVAAIDLGGPLVGARLRVELTGELSGVTVATVVLSIYEVRDGLVHRQWITDDVAELEGWLREAGHLGAT